MIFEEVPRTEDHASWTSLSTAARPTPGAPPSSLTLKLSDIVKRTPPFLEKPSSFLSLGFCTYCAFARMRSHPFLLPFPWLREPTLWQPSQFLGHMPCHSLSQTLFLLQHFPECMTLPILSVLATSPSRAGFMPHVQHLAWASDGTQLTLTGPLDWMNGSGAPTFLLLKNKGFSSF